MSDEFNSGEFVMKDGVYSVVDGILTFVRPLSPLPQSVVLIVAPVRPSKPVAQIIQLSDYRK